MGTSLATKEANVFHPVDQEEAERYPQTARADPEVVVSIQYRKERIAVHKARVMPLVGEESGLVKAALHRVGSVSSSRTLVRTLVEDKLQTACFQVGSSLMLGEELDQRMASSSLHAVALQ